MRFFSALFIILCCFNLIYGQIVTIDKNSTSKNEVIHDLLALQKSLIIPSQKPIPKERAKTGFLIVSMKPEFVEHLLEKKDGCIICDYRDHTLVGYILLTDTTEFKELYQDAAIGRFETSLDLNSFETWASQPTVGYIEQIAVEPNYSRTGIGHGLMEVAKALRPDGLIADVFIYPVMNEPSLKFFSRQGFTKPGILHQTSAANSNFPYEHRTQAFIWKALPT